MRTDAAVKPGLRVALCGNPNVGKSTVFNALTGLRQHTGNWTGKTVETAQGKVLGSKARWTLTDLPGTYSLLTGSPEDEVACDFLCFARQDAVIVVCDATCLERNLNLTLQALQGMPRVVVCLNLMDEACRMGVRIDAEALEARLGASVVPCAAKGGQGLAELKRRVEEVAAGEWEAARVPGQPDSCLLCCPAPVGRRWRGWFGVRPGLAGNQALSFWPFGCWLQGRAFGRALSGVNRASEKSGRPSRRPGKGWSRRAFRPRPRLPPWFPPATRLPRPWRPGGDAAPGAPA